MLPVGSSIFIYLNQCLQNHNLILRHTSVQKKYKSLAVTVKSNLDGFSFFLVYVSLTDHKIRDFIARQLVSAQRWGGCSVFTVRDVLLVGVQPLQKRID